MDAPHTLQAEFAALPPTPTHVEAGGERLELTPIRVGELPAFVRAIRPFAEQLMQAVDWLALFAEHGEALLDALAIASRRPKDWVEALALDDAIRLADALLEVNADFFIRRVSPEVGRVAHRLAARAAGPAPSPGSCAPATATPTS